MSTIGARGRSTVTCLILPGIPRSIRWSSKECVYWRWVTSLACLTVIGPRIRGSNGYRRPSMQTMTRNLRSTDIRPHRRAHRAMSWNPYTIYSTFICANDVMVYGQIFWRWVGLHQGCAKALAEPSRLDSRGANEVVHGAYATCAPLTTPMDPYALQLT